jgi:hypothetical protein
VAEKHTAMLPALKEVGRAISWTWLRVNMHCDQQKGGGGA